MQADQALIKVIQRPVGLAANDRGGRLLFVRIDHHLRQPFRRSRIGREFGLGSRFGLFLFFGSLFFSSRRCGSLFFGPRCCGEKLVEVHLLFRRCFFLRRFILVQRLEEALQVFLRWCRSRHFYHFFIFSGFFRFFSRRFRFFFVFADQVQPVRGILSNLDRLFEVGEPVRLFFLVTEAHLVQHPGVQCGFFLFFLSQPGERAGVGHLRFHLVEEGFVIFLARLFQFGSEILVKAHVTQEVVFRRFSFGLYFIRFLFDFLDIFEPVGFFLAVERLHAQIPFRHFVPQALDVGPFFRFSEEVFGDFLF